MKYILTGILIEIILRVWNFFLRYEYLIDAELMGMLAKKENFIHAGWHNNTATYLPIFSTFFVKKYKYKTAALVSQSKDGDMASFIAGRFSIETVRGSSSKGAKAAFKKILKMAKNGKMPVFTPDGPRGPLHKIKQGTILTASITGLPVVTYCTYPKRYYEFPKSWDKHRFPKFENVIKLERN